MRLLDNLFKPARRLVPFTKHDAAAHLKVIDEKLEAILSHLQKFAPASRMRGLQQ